MDPKDDLFDVIVARDDGPIPLDAWLAVVAADPELQLVDTLRGRNPRTGEFVDVHMPNAARWTAHPHSIDFCFRFENGQVVGSWVDSHLFEKAKTIAAALGARVLVSLD